mmetsp:Transcript_9733/g.22938  ORF Transcript_9733/g.22938 Transcript_9733/m.22938 type:complete len:281 (-) Transcript_9733:135-977(-)
MKTRGNSVCPRRHRTAALLVSKRTSCNHRHVPPTVSIDSDLVEGRHNSLIGHTKADASTRTQKTMQRHSTEPMACSYRRCVLDATLLLLRVCCIVPRRERTYLRIRWLRCNPNPNETAISIESGRPNTWDTKHGNLLFPWLLQIVAVVVVVVDLAVVVVTGCKPHLLRRRNLRPGRIPKGQGGNLPTGEVLVLADVVVVAHGSTVYILRELKGGCLVCVVAVWCLSVQLVVVVFQSLGGIDEFPDLGLDLLIEMGVHDPDAPPEGKNQSQKAKYLSGDLV